ncbi:NAD(P)-binding protein [Glonium stellatum]|uniref:NAD(P)-binding protein n=1 Tax=Glonium stellatum TaxID=574774 RepID=A0A8E2EUU0_9PEZI|nr:NAD(P)-binding protein [Glonium stellatum]
MAGLRGYANLPSYSAIKYAIIGFTKADGLRHATDLIRVNAICPGSTETPLLGEVSDDIGTSTASMTKDVAVGRLGLPEEVAESLVWIVSHRASLVTATTLAANGGMVGA